VECLPQAEEKKPYASNADENKARSQAAITRAGGLLAKRQLLLNNKSKSSFSYTCSSVREMDTFRELFGVNVPVGFTDTAAVGVMIARKKAGKLADLKSPLAYLVSLVGKVAPMSSVKRSRPTRSAQIT